MDLIWFLWPNICMKHPGNTCNDSVTFEVMTTSKLEAHTFFNFINILSRSILFYLGKVTGVGGGWVVASFYFICWYRLDLFAGFRLIWKYLYLLPALERLLGTGNSIPTPSLSLKSVASNRNPTPNVLKPSKENVLSHKSKPFVTKIHFFPLLSSASSSPR